MRPSTQTDQGIALPPTALSAARVLQMSIAADPARVREVRDSVRAAMVTWGTEAWADVMALLASELVSNSLQHSGTQDIGVFLELDDERVLLEVTDTGDQRPALREAAEYDMTGRGLFLVESLSTEWGCRGEAGGGKTVWASLVPAVGATA